MKIYRSIATNRKTQGFGLKNTAPSLLASYQSFGLAFHQGLDFSLWYKEPIFWNCNQRGEVIYAGGDVNEGMGVSVISRDTDGTYYQHRFWHLIRFACKSGDILESGEIIGYGDSTGFSTGNHLHYDLKKVRKNENGTYTTLNWNNGVKGAIDPTPYFKNKFILDVMKELSEECLTLAQKVLKLIKRLWQKQQQS